MTIEEGCQKDWKDVTDDPIANTGEGWITRDDLSVIPKDAVGKFIDFKIDGCEYINIHSGYLNWNTRAKEGMITHWRLTRSPLLCEEVKAQDVHSLNRSMIRPEVDGESLMRDAIENAKPGVFVDIGSYQGPVKQERYLDKEGKKDHIDECAETYTPEEFRAAMKFTIDKYRKRLGKKDVMSSELYKISDYYRRWSEYEKVLEG